jgi:hypothetical protein
MKAPLLAALVIVGAALPSVRAAEPRIFYSKSFPGSTPAYVEIIVEKNGEVTYRESPDDDQPIKFRLSEADTAEVFGLAEKLDRFERTLESGLKVAKTGVKTFRWEDGTVRNEQKFNYSSDLQAQALLDWFERITETEQHLINLERAVRFDRLGVNKALLLMEASWDRRRLVAVDQFLPMLERVIKNESFLNMARERAAYLADAFRGKAAPTAQPTSGQGQQ